jgi:hypothetical protein
MFQPLTLQEIARSIELDLNGGSFNDPAVAILPVQLIAGVTTVQISNPNGLRARTRLCVTQFAMERHLRFRWNGIGGLLNTRPLFHFCCFLFLLFCLSALHAQDLDLHGTIVHQQADSYVLVPFEVPSGIKRLDVSFSYTGREDHTTLDLGLLDPQRFRGWSGGNKHAFSIGIADATPSYLPGPLPPGTWKLLIGVAYLGEGHTSTYQAPFNCLAILFS